MSRGTEGDAVVSGVGEVRDSGAKMVKLGDVITPAKCERAGQRIVNDDA